MNLYIRQRIFSWTDSYDVYDETGEARYEVRSAFFSLGHQIHVYDKRAGEGHDEVGCIRQKLFSLLPTFEIEIGGRVVGTIQKKLTLFRQSYLVDYRGWDVEGDVMGWDYRVMENGQQIMSIPRNCFASAILMSFPSTVSPTKSPRCSWFWPLMPPTAATMTEPSRSVHRAA